MRKLATLFLLLFLCLPSTVLAVTKQHYVALCDITPYKLVERLQTGQSQFKEKDKIHFFDIRKSASSSEFVFCKIGKNSPNCTMTISASNLPSGLTRIVSIRTIKNTDVANDDFADATALMFCELGLSADDVSKLNEQEIPSPYYDSHACSIWKNNRRIIVFLHFEHDGHRSMSFYAVNSPRYIN